MNLPSSFKIANQIYTVTLVHHLEDANFGEFDSVKAEIRVASHVLSSYTNEFIKLSEEQVLNSYWHEVFHCFNWHMNTECDETLAQSFANFIREYLTSVQNATNNQ